MRRRAKRRYAPPKVTRIPLAASEVTFMGCKLGLSTGNKMSKCDSTAGGCVNLAAGS